MKKYILIASILLTSGLFINGYAGYDKVHINNTTDQDFKVRIDYRGGTSSQALGDCHRDEFEAKANATSKPKAGRGLCLVKKISAESTSGDDKANSYTSSGTSYVHFKIVKDDKGNYTVEHGS